MAEDEVVKAISTVMDALSPLDAEAREHVLEFVVKRLGLAVLKPQLAPATPAIPGHTPPPAPPAGDTDIRSFAALKAPKTLNEKVAVMAFFLCQMAGPGERRDYITSEDIKPYFIQADFELPTGPANMTLTNAKNAGYLNALERGQYKLNSVGHNLVAHKLPKKEGSSKPARKPKPVKKTAKKGKR
ncbi:MAG: hypothetical protein JWP25_7837 [Bradyrhizobium sp.]|nr:hypothetical protein [Bradyrhizobium sp.]